MKSKFALVTWTLVISALMAGGARAQDARNQGYLLDPHGAIVISATTGLCWRSSDWTPARAVASCDRVATPTAYAPPTSPSPAPAESPVVIAAAVIEAAENPPEPPKAMPQKVSFSADALFAFDNAELTPHGKAMLNDFAQQLQGLTYDTILATGHADRFGGVKYNQELSMRRAHAVKDYLIGREVLASRIEASGRGKHQPVTTPGACPGALSAKVIACLQPDRRVDIEMHGTKTIIVTQ